MKDAQWYSKLYKDEFEEMWKEIKKNQAQDLWLTFADFVRVELALYAVETQFPTIVAEDFGYLLQGIPVKSLQTKKKLIYRLRGYLRTIRSQGSWQSLLDQYLNSPALYRVRGYTIDNQGRPIQCGSSCGTNRYHSYRNYLQNPAPHQKRPKYKPAPKGNYLILDSENKPHSVQISQKLAECGLAVLPRINITSKKGQTRQKIVISFEELIAIAEELDQKVGGNWVHRVKDALDGLYKVTKSGLRKAKELCLNGKEHLLGPCAAGKTTLFTVITIYLERNQYRTAIVYRDVRALLNQADLFHRVHCSPGIVIGRQNWEKHYIRLLVDNVDFNHYAYTQFNQACPLSVFLSSPLPFGEEPPCMGRKLQMADDPEKTYDCPLLPVCPRHQGTRDLGNAAIILTTPPGMVYAGPSVAIQPEQTVWLETIYKTCDVVFVDEGDSVQAQMDSDFAPAQTFESTRQGADTFCRLLNQALTTGSHEGRIGTPNPDRSDITFAFSHYPRLLKTANDLMNLLYEADHKKYTSLASWIEHSHFFAGWQIFGTLADVLSGQEPENPQREDLFKAFIAFRSRPTAPDTNLLNPEQQQIVQGLVNILQATEDPRQVKTVIRNWLNTQTWPLSIAEMSMSVYDLIPLVELGVYASATLYRLNLIIDRWGLLEPYMRPDADLPRVLSPKPEEYDDVLPVTPYGASVALQWYRNEKERDLRYLKVESCGRWILTHWDELYLGDDVPPPHLVIASATSWSPPSYAYDVQISPTMVIKPSTSVNEAIESSEFFFAPLKDRHNKFISVSRSWDTTRFRRLESMVEALTRPDAMGECELTRERKLLESRDPQRGKLLLVTGSYTETNWVADCLSKILGNDAVAWLSPDGSGVNVKQFQIEPGGQRVPRGQVSTFAKLEAWILVAPLMALERGHNIVLDDGRAAIGCIQLLVRPHPRPDALAPYIHLLNRWFIETYPTINIGNPITEIKALRSRASKLWSHLMTYPLFYSRLPEEFKTEKLPLRSSFAWSLIVPLIQLIGRTTRGGVPTRVFFRDVPFAEATAAGNASNETASTSILVACEEELEKLCTHCDPKIKALATALFAPLWKAFKNRQVKI